MLQVRFFEYYTLGLEEKFPEGYSVTEEEIIEFGQRWDPQPFHTDPEAARQSHFGGLVASSVHLFAIAVRLGTSVPQDKRAAAVSALGFTNMHLKAPARVGDTLSLNIRVIDSRKSKSKPSLGVVGMYHELRNQNNEIVFTFDDAFLVRKGPRSQ
jgi:acyl dehydratase